MLKKLHHQNAALTRHWRFLPCPIQALTPSCMSWRRRSWTPAALAAVSRTPLLASCPPWRRPAPPPGQNWNCSHHVITHQIVWKNMRATWEMRFEFEVRVQKCSILNSGSFLINAIQIRLFWKLNFRCWLCLVTYLTPVCHFLFGQEAKERGEPERGGSQSDHRSARSFLYAG